jgi:hypothetical protein
MDIHQAKIEDNHEEWMAIMQASQDTEAMMEACLEKAKANPEKLKAGLEEMEATVKKGWIKWTPRIWRQHHKKSRPQWSGKRSLMKRSQWKIMQHWRTDMGTGAGYKAHQQLKK